MTKGSAHAAETVAIATHAPRKAKEHERPKMAHTKDVGQSTCPDHHDG